MSNPPPQFDDLDQLKQALAALKKARARIANLEQSLVESIAIVGIGCRLPGDANNAEAFWQLLRTGRNAVVEVPAERWDAQHYYDPHSDTPGKMRAISSGFIKNVDHFDPHFFGISPREANAMDPQQRLALEVAWEALEDAGIIPAHLAGSKTGVFIGIGINDYGRIQVIDQELNPARLDNYFIQGNALCVTANRLSYALDLHGPSMAIDSACSSSLVAVQAACQSLRSGEITLALAGGSNVILSPAVSISLGKFLSPDGLCKSFDSRADGYTRGEGSIIIVLKRLSDALNSRDRIYALIRDVAVNQDGFSSGLTVPNGLAQEAMLREALSKARVKPDEIDFIEAHGTGTALGDPIEANALGAVFAPGRERGQELLIGSVKTNIGHLEAAAGIAGLLKVALALYYNEIPPSLNYIRPNPQIDFDRLHLSVVTTLTTWPQRDHPSRAGVSSFGFGGTNAHAILEAPPDLAPQPLPEIDRPVHLLTLSAKTPQALSEQAQRFSQFLSDHPAAALADVCYSANNWRTHFTHRLAVSASSISQIQAELAALSSGQPSTSLISSGRLPGLHPKVAFLFTGQGSQYSGMGRQLYQTQPTFKDALDRCDAILQPILGQSLLSVIYAQEPSDQSKSLIDQTAFTQPALFTFEFALAELWRSWGIEPSVLLGHSIGEFVAACLAGVMSLEDSLKLVAARGRLMGALPAGGEMAAVFATLEHLNAAIAPFASTVSVAALNGPDSLVISGAGPDLHLVLERLQSEGIKSKKLVVSHAFHSPLMEPILDEFEAVARSCRFEAPRLPLVSNVTGRIFEAGELPDAGYWRQHIRRAVNFAAGMQTLYARGFNVFLEIGPHPALLGMGKRCLPDGYGIWLPSIRQGQDEWPQMLKSLGMLYCSGLEIDWTGFERDYARGRKRISIPSYAFQRERFWFQPPGTDPVAELRATGQAEDSSGGVHPLLGKLFRSPAIQGTVFEARISPGRQSYLRDHRVYETIIFPATGYIEMGLAAAHKAFNSEQNTLEELVIQEAMILPVYGATSVQVILTPQADGCHRMQICSARVDSTEWQFHAEARLRPGLPADSSSSLSLADAQALCPEEVSPADFYEFLHRTGMEYGSNFQNIIKLWRGENRALGKINLSELLLSEADQYKLHPALLDACFQVLGLAVPAQSSETYLPVSIDQIVFTGTPGNELWSCAVLDPDGTTQMLLGDVFIFNNSGDLVLRAAGLRLQRAGRDAIKRLARRVTGETRQPNWLYKLSWKLQPQPPLLQRDSKAGGWLVLADQESGAGPALAELLEGSTLAIPGQASERTGEKNWQNAPSSVEDYQRLVNSSTDREGHPLYGVVYLWECESRSNDEQRLRLEALLHLIQALAKEQASPHVWLATKGAQPVLSEDVRFEQAALWGLARSARLEHPDLHFTCIDLDPASLPLDNARFLSAEIQSQSVEDEVAYRNNERYVSRLVEAQEAIRTIEMPLRLEITARGLLENLTLRSYERRQPGIGEVEIRVRATGLNFRDVLNTLDLYPGEAGGLGHECAGTITAVGQNVIGLQVGDEVLALASDCFSSFAVARSEFVALKPKEMSFEEAATIPIAFLTADYALHTLGGLQTGERVLIHAAAGGVGLAAVQLALNSGAEIFATAGSPEKRHYLQRLGIKHVLDSRSLSFADQVLELTGGEGVDVVLNSLTDEFIPKSLSVLRSGGRFLEIGKRGVWTAEQVASLGRQIDYHLIYLGAVSESQPDLIQGRLRDLVSHFQNKELRPLPWRAYPVTQATAAFRYMSQARHLGKIVLTQPTAASSVPPVSSDGTYLITGGLGGLGLVSAQSLVKAGARSIVLVGRREPSLDAAAIIQQMEQSGAQITLIKADISQAEQCERVLETIRNNLPPLRGIIHAAGVLADGVLMQQNWEQFANVWAPKVDACWELHRLTMGIRLDFFVIFTAGAGILGSAGQANYAAANAALDGLAQYRRARGLPAVSIAWGPWGEVGMASRMSVQDLERLSRQGLGIISPDQGAQILESLLGKAETLAVLPIDWERFITAYSEHGLPPMFSNFTRPVQSNTLSLRRGQAPDLLKRLGEAPPNKRKPGLLAYVREQAIRVLGLDNSYPVDARQPLREIGLDSLMAVELRNAFESGLHLKLPSTLLFDYPSLESLTTFLAQELWPPETTPEDPAPSRESRTQAQEVADLEQLSEAEAEAMLMQELAALKKDR